MGFAVHKTIESNGKTVLVTGGAGYIASHCAVTLQEAGYDVIALDCFANSVRGDQDESIALKRVEQITGKAVTFYKADLLDTQYLDKIFQNVSDTIRPASASVHFEFSCSTKSIRSSILLQ